MKDKLKVVTRIKKTIIYFDKLLENYPHKHLDIKNNINKSLYDLLELVYLSNEFDRDKNLSLSLAKLQMIDFYLYLSYKNDIIGKKNFEKLSKHLLDIRNMIYGLKNYEEI